MRQRGFYTLGFLLVLAAAVAGAYFGRELAGTVEPPNLEFVNDLQVLVDDLDLASFLPSFGPSTGPAPSASEEPTVAAGEVQPSPVAASLAVETIEATPLAEVAAPASSPAPQPTPAERATSTPAPPTPTPTPDPSRSFAFLPLGDLAHGNQDCTGPSIRGIVRDVSGNALPGVRLWRYDQWGNQQTVETKSGAADLGQYDFPLGDTANIHYVQIVDASGSPISPSVEVLHGQGDAADAFCHWLDWVRRNPTG
jgi:hypothetical protein